VSHVRLSYLIKELLLLDVWL